MMKMEIHSFEMSYKRKGLSPGVKPCTDGKKEKGIYRHLPPGDPRWNTTFPVKGPGKIFPKQPA